MPGTIQRTIKVFRSEGAGGLRKRLDRRLRRVAFRIARRMNRPTFRSAYGVRLVANWNDATFRFCATGAYGEFLSSYLAHQTDPFCFVDIGANQGLYSLLAARNPACRMVYAFEPVPQTADLLESNITLNDVDARCRVVRKAISDSVGTISIALPDGHSGAAAIGRMTETARQVEIETIDARGFGHELRGTTAQLLVKVDVEGHEAVVIDQILQSSEADRITAIFYECDERWIDAEALRARLEEAGFRQFQKVGKGQHYDVLANREAR